MHGIPMATHSRDSLAPKRKVHLDIDDMKRKSRPPDLEGETGPLEKKQSKEEEVRVLFSSDGDMKEKTRYRGVLPYHSEFVAHCKRRWEGRTLLDVFQSEFVMHPREYYARAVASGRIYIQRRGAKCDSQELRANDVVHHRVHRHEPLVRADCMLLHADEKLVVANKSHSLPVHSCGKYHHNVLTEVLRRDLGVQGKLFPVHRLDVCTSGVVVLARDSVTAGVVSKQMEQHLLHKHYLARVHGNFEGRGGRLSLAVETKSGKTKSSATTFRFLSHDLASDTSLVHCEPETGRTHQIRQHLLHLGFPIVYDEKYGGRTPPSSSSSACRDVLDALQAGCDDEETIARFDERLQQTSADVGRVDEDCPFCCGEAEEMRFSNRILLHAWKYEYDGNGGEQKAWKFEAPPPAWGQIPSVIQPSSSSLSTTNVHQ